MDAKWRRWLLAVASLMVLQCAAFAAVPGAVYVNWPTSQPAGWTTRPQQWFVGDSFNYAVAAPNATAYAVQGLPPGLTLDASTGAITGTFSASGTFSMTFTATNSEGSSTLTTGLTVQPARDSAPVIDPIPDIDVAFMGGSPHVDRYGEYQILINASDGPTSYGATGLPPSGTYFDPKSGTLDYNVNDLPTGRFTSTLSATNQFGTGTTTVHWTVHPALVDNGIVPTRSSYIPGETVSLLAHFTGPVVVTGQPYVQLNSRAAYYSSGSGNSTIVFSYVANQDDIHYSPQTVYPTVTLNGGTIRSPDGIDAVVAGMQARETAFPSFSVIPGTSRPAVIGVTPPSAGSYSVGSTLDFVVHFSETVTVGSTAYATPYLGFYIGGQYNQALWVASGPSRDLTFRYTVRQGQQGTVTLSEIQRVGVTIQNGEGIDADIAFTPPDTSGVFVDAAGPAPKVTAFSYSSFPPRGGTAVAVVQFDLNVYGVDASDFELTTTGGVTAQMGTVTRSNTSDAAFLVNFNYSGDNGSLTLRLKSSGTGIFSIAGAAFTGGGITTLGPTDIPAPVPGKADQTITFSSPVSAVAVGRPITLGALSSAGLPITYSIVIGAATLSGNVLTPTSTATLIVRAASAGDATYNPASTDVNFGAPQKGVQVITSTLRSVTANSTVPLDAASSAGLPVSYALVSGPATLSGNVLTVTGTSGTIQVRASQSGSDAYNAASDVTLTLNIIPVGNSRLVNISSRVRVSGGDADGPTIAGFVISGSSPRQILIRGVGPTLSVFSLPNPIGAPQLTLFDNNGAAIGANAGWANNALIAAAGSAVGAFDLRSGSTDAALLVTLPPGAYTTQLRSSTTGTGLIEIYDAPSSDAPPTRNLVNISTRGVVGSGDDVLIGGFVVAGDSPKRMLVRAVGPGLTQLKVSGVLNDPLLKLYDAKSAVVAQNDNWGAAQVTAAGVLGSPAEIAAAATAVGAFPLPNGSADSAIVITLNPGQYTAIASGPDNQTGTALIEVYELP